MGNSCFCACVLLYWVGSEYELSIDTDMPIAQKRVFSHVSLSTLGKPHKEASCWNAK